MGRFTTFGSDCPNVFEISFTSIYIPFRRSFSLRTFFLWLSWRLKSVLRLAVSSRHVFLCVEPLAAGRSKWSSPFVPPRQLGRGIDGRAGIEQAANRSSESEGSNRTVTHVI